ncbi:MAG: thymidine kinase [Clostridiales Family XIII bacterium]|jgi:thymidine kinase|nr:thymidine kinase [Clostridiales Family XIII bacterium]
MAKFKYVYGTVKAGKSTALLQVVHNYEQNWMKALLIKPKRDTKGNDSVVSRLGVSRKVDYLADTGEGLHAFLHSQSCVACVVCDEVQFLEQDCIDVLWAYCKKANVPVLAYGLRTDYTGKAFPASIRCFELADEVEELAALCNCGRKGRFNYKLNQENTNSAGIEDEGVDKYRPMCGQCYYESAVKGE